MKKVALSFLILLFLGCSIFDAPETSEKMAREYASDAITVSDFSMKIIGYYRAQNTAVPKTFDTKQFFDLLGKLYPDQERVNSIKDHYRVSVRSLDNGYSVMLCDPDTNLKVMEDLSCHLNRTEIRSWQENMSRVCAFEKNWNSFCD